MKIALVGYGKMGKMIETISGTYNIEIAEYFDINNFLKENEETGRILKNIPVLIEFTLPETAPENIRIGTALGKNMVVGTTGWNHRMEDVKKWVEEAGTGLVYGNNFSLGVNLFYRIVDFASGILSKFEEYDSFIEESHHQFKKDAPSGTALSIRKIMQKSYNKEVPITSTRAGYIPGTHSVGFDSQVDTMQFTHTARSRAGFAEGALLAAKWVRNKKGIFTFEEVIADMLS